MIPVSIGSAILKSHRRIVQQEMQAVKMKRCSYRHAIGNKGVIARFLLGIKF